jgi:triacylglycerol lipase
MGSDPLKLKHPIVLVHGLGGRSQYGPVGYFYRIPELLRNAGNTVFIPDLTPFHTTEHRAQQLKQQIEKELPEGRVNLIGHSFGGLDCRYVASMLGFEGRVASVTTIGTPNRGTVIVDIALGLVPDVTFHMADQLLTPFRQSSRAYPQLTTKYCNETFAEQAPDAKGVAYFSATSVIRSPVMRTALPLFWLPSKIIQRYEGENDGFVSLYSSKWGEHICTYTGDHYAQIGQFLGFSRGLDYISFFSEIVGRLRREGF